ncbi:GL26559 [Drosophila persimilis]|uniref:GL26559 n=1 Tax=Drosophila persimilis TaxID=7234 RepID=B4GSL1_DROPE|nr:GL26559 [Drosophila persimilis]
MSRQFVCLCIWHGNNLSVENRLVPIFPSSSSSTPRQRQQQQQQQIRPWIAVQRTLPDNETLSEINKDREDGELFKAVAESQVSQPGGSTYRDSSAGVVVVVDLAGLQHLLSWQQLQKSQQQEQAQQQQPQSFVAESRWLRMRGCFQVESTKVKSHLWERERGQRQGEKQRNS